MSYYTRERVGVKVWGLRPFLKSPGSNSPTEATVSGSRRSRSLPSVHREQMEHFFNQLLKFGKLKLSGLLISYLSTGERQQKRPFVLA
jgi:hypothetical protein